MEVQTCKHPACSCQLSGKDEFCCDGCREASKDVARNSTCDCEHGQCGPHT